MADNIGYTPGTGATIAADEIGGVLYQRMKIGIGADGTATDISTSNPMPANLTAPIAVSSTTGTVTTQETGELVEAIEALRMAVQSLNRTVGQVLPDSTGRMRVNIETGSNVAITSLPTLSTVTTVGTVTTVATTTNQTQMGGIIAVDQVPALMCIAAQGLRRNITVT
jgi:hypothetical protein